MGLGDGVGEERFHAAKAFGKGDQLQSSKHGLGQFGRRYLKGYHAPVPAGLSLLERIARMIGQPRVVHLCDLRLLFQPMGNFESIFCLPLHTYLDLVTIHLRMLAVSIAHGTLQGAGVEIVRRGTMLASPTGSFAVDVADPCSGMRSLFAMMALTAGYAYFTQPTWTRRALLFALAIPIAVLGNVVRILSIVAVGATCSGTFAMGFYHDYSGYVVFLVAIFLMVATGGLIAKLAERREARQCARS